MVELILGVIGIMIMILGLLIWKEQKIHLIHGYHYENINKSDIPDYTKAIGKNITFIGVFLIITAIIDYLYATQYIWWVFLGVLVYIFYRMVHIQRKYNGSVF